MSKPLRTVAFVALVLAAAYWLYCFVEGRSFLGVDVGSNVVVVSEGSPERLRCRLVEVADDYIVVENQLNWSPEFRHVIPKRAVQLISTHE